MILVGKKYSGFTIIEIMIVLASTGALLSIAIIMVGGQINKSNFQQGQRSAQLDFQNIVNEVTSGSFLFSKTTSCSPIYNTSPTPNSLTITDNTTSTQGQNNGCIFLGKSIYLKNSQRSSSYGIYNVVGTQCSAILTNGECSTPVSDIVSATPTLVTAKNDVLFNTLKNNLTIKYIQGFSNTSSNYYCGLAILSVSSINSGGQQYILEGVGDNGATSDLLVCAYRPSGSPSNIDIDMNNVHTMNNMTVCLQYGQSTRELKIQSGSTGILNTVQGNSITVSLGVTGC